MKRLLGALALFLATLLPWGAARAQEESESKYLPTVVMNGEGWKRVGNIDEQWGMTFKVCLLRGIYEGAYALDPQNAYEQFGPWVTFRELALSLDRFYIDERNRQIPVTYALVLMQAKNAPGSKTPKSADFLDPGARRSLVSVEKRKK